MVVVTSVFLTQLLCVIVPCDPQYQLPDTRPLVKKEIENDWLSQFSLKSEKQLHQATQELQQQQPFHSNQFFIDVHQLNSGSKSPLLYSNECLDEHPYVTTKAGIIEGTRIQVVGGRKICAFQGVPYAEVVSPFAGFHTQGFLKS